MAVLTLPLNYDLVIYTGTTFRREFRWSDGSAPLDLTGWTALCNIGLIGTAALKTLTSSNGGIILTGTGQIILSLAPADTAALKPGTLAYNLDLASPDGQVRRFLRGRVSVIQDVKSAS